MAQKIWKMGISPDNFIADTVNLTNEELGLYFRLLCYAWKNEATLPNDMDRLKRVCQNVKINGGWVNVEKCPICNSKKKKIWQIKNKIPIYVCSNCLTGYSGKKAKNIADVYDSKSQLKQHKISYDYSINLRKKLMGIERIRLLKRFKKKDIKKIRYSHKSWGLH